MCSYPEEEGLTGGNVGARVVRVGNTVRRPAGFWSPSVDAFLRHLNEVGYEGAPRSLGFDSTGRHVVEYIEGDVPMPFQPGDHLGQPAGSEDSSVTSTTHRQAS